MITTVTFPLSSVSLEFARSIKMMEVRERERKETKIKVKRYNAMGDMVKNREIEFQCDR